MGIRKGKSDKIDIDGLIGGTGNKDEALRVERCLTEKMEELKLTTAALNAAIDRIGSIVSNFNSSVQEMQAKEIGAQVHPQTLKSLNNICTNFVVEVGRQLMARIARMLEKSKGVWLSDSWVKVLFVFFLLCTTIVIIYAKHC